MCRCAQTSFSHSGLVFYSLHQQEAITHFAVGALKALITIRSWWASGLEMTIVGVIEAAVTYGLGLAFAAIT